MVFKDRFLPLYPSEDKLTIASYNIENFSANTQKGETPDEKVTKIANSFINEIHSPDIITLIEVQDDNGSVNDGTTSGVKSGEKLAARIKELGGKTTNILKLHLLMAKMVVNLDLISV